jgi:hypothetical protein
MFDESNQGRLNLSIPKSHEVEARRTYENDKAGVIYMALRPGQSLKNIQHPLTFSSTFPKEREL